MKNSCSDLSKPPVRWSWSGALIGAIVGFLLAFVLAGTYYASPTVTVSVMAVCTVALAWFGGKGRLGWLRSEWWR